MIMGSLIDYIKEAEAGEVALGHFNISDLAGLKGIFEAARELNLPIIIGVSEGEREFIGVRQVVALIRSLREEFDYPIFLNADHTHSFEKAKEAAEAGFDAILFDPFDPAQGRGGKLPLEENIKETKVVVDYIKNFEPSILVEGELGYIGSGSTIIKGVPEGAAVKREDMTKPEDAERFVEETKIDLLGPAVGNLHGMFADAPNPDLAIDLISQIRQSARVPLVLHGGSGIKDSDLKSAIDAGISIIHINTEIRLAWRKGLETALKANPEEIAPYKIMPGAISGVKKVVSQRLRLFNRLI